MEGTSLVFRSQFFKVSGFQLSIIPPEPIDLSTIALHFDEMLAESYVVLSVHCVLVSLFFILMIVLKYVDIKDETCVSIGYHFPCCNPYHTFHLFIIYLSLELNP